MASGTALSFELFAKDKNAVGSWTITIDAKTPEGATIASAATSFTITVGTAMTAAASASKTTQ